MSARRQASRARSRAVPKAAQPARSVPVLALAGVLAVTGLWAYSTSFAGVFVLDDVRAIVRNPTIRALWPLSTPLSPPSGATVSGRPIANLTLAINHALAPPDVRGVFGPGNPGAPPGTAERFLRNVWGYHFLNLVIHVAAALTLFGVVRRTLLSPSLRGRFEKPATWLAFVAALLWLVHPLQTESVTYVVQRVESLMGLFYLLTLYCAIRAAETPRARAWAAGAIVCCALGMATKETMVTAPIMVWMWYRVFGEGQDDRPRWVLLAGLAATWSVLAVLVYHEYRAPSVELERGVVGSYLATQAAVVMHYLRLAVVPTPLVFLYTWPLASSFAAVAPQAMLLTALVVLTIIGIVRRHPLGFAGTWFFLILAPTSSVLPIVTEVAAEHRMYLPLAAVVVCAVVGAHVIADLILTRRAAGLRVRRRAGLVGAALAVALVVTYGTATRARNRDYWSEERLWLDTVTKQPGNQRARVAYGVALSTAGRLADAEAQLQIAVDLVPGDPVAQGRLGAVQAAQGKVDPAITHLERALAMRPDDVDAHRWLGEAYASRRQDALAIAHLERALAVMTDDPVLLSHLAALLADSPDASLRDGVRAVDLAERAARLTSRRNALILDILSVAYASVGRYAAAASTAEEALGVARAEGNGALVSELEYRASRYRARR